MHLGFTVLPSATNFLFIKPPRLSAAEVFAALRARKILVRYFPGELTGEYLRVTIGTDAASTSDTPLPRRRAAASTGSKFTA